MEEAVLSLSQALKSGSESLKKSHVLHCSVIITFFGANDLKEKEKSMKIKRRVPRLISFLSTLLEREDRAIQIIAGEAIALIF